MKSKLLILFVVLLAAFSLSIEINIKKAQSDVNSDIDELVAYLKSLQNENGIDYVNVQNTAAYIPPICYTKTETTNDSLDDASNDDSKVFNPCYSCHTQGAKPNYTNDLRLQASYDFPEFAFDNKWDNVFADNSKQIEAQSDESILEYINRDNYFTDRGEIYLSSKLNSSWPGYVPDCYFNFDDEGFDINPKTEQYTGWRAFRYYPFLGTFWPTNGSTDDVLIRLADYFMKDENGNFNKEIYKINLSIVEALVKQRNITTEPLDESLVNYDLDGDGIIAKASAINYTWPDGNMSYVGLAKTKLSNGEIYIAGGLYPLDTEFLHTVRYIGVKESGEISLSPRMKEVRYGKKLSWMSYSELRNISYLSAKEFAEGQDPIVESFYGNFAAGYLNAFGWTYQGFIEDKNGALRPQTNEETIFCIDCHDLIGATTDSIFSFTRKLEGTDKNDKYYGWNHWSQKGLNGLKDQPVEYKKFGAQNEYSFYLENNGAGDEFRENDEVMDKGWNSDGSIKTDMIEQLKEGVSILLLPTKERALKLNKAYKATVQQQTFIKGRDAIIKPAVNVHEEIKKGDKTNISQYIY
ncbi:hypothetical protein MCHI_001788 [Candidatus Magnetoovum chiemensis]|nr:hypothetical protein MCHI_001788 [Candidatus Magnetoovum chiemensis]